MTNDEILIARLGDIIGRAADKYMITSSGFLDMHQRKMAEDYCKSHKLPLRVVFYGGYEDAERCLAICLPDYVEAGGGFAARFGVSSGNEANCAGSVNSVPEAVKDLFRVVRVSVPKGSRQLSHRDYLGSLLALGLDREVTGDILVRKASERDAGGADIIVEAEIAQFIELNYEKAGRTTLKAEVLHIDELDVGEVDIAVRHDTVASLRLDSIVASAFGMSRAKAAEAIRRGIVSVNSIETLKVDMEVHEKDKVVMRGKGKVVLAELGGTTRKDRIRIRFDVYGSR